MDENKFIIKHPHDHFFKVMFSDPEKVKEFLNGALSVKINSKLDFESLRQDPNSYIDEQLKDFYSDVVYECNYNGEYTLNLAFLFEHKSYITKYPRFQLLRYILNIWDSQIDQEGKPKLIIPMIIYHGQDIWKKRSLKEYFVDKHPEELIPFVPDFDYILINLRDKKPKEIREQFQSLHLQIGFLMMKFIKDVNLEELLNDILEGANELLGNEKDRRYFQQIFVYLYTAAKIKTEKIMDKARIISQEAADLVESTAMQLMREGMEKGMQKGMEKGAFLNLQDNISKLLLKGFTTPQVSDMLEVEFSLVEEIEAKLRSDDKLS